MIALPAAVAQEGVKVRMADAVALSMDLTKVDTQIGRAGANGRGSQNLRPMVRLP